MLLVIIVVFIVGVLFMGQRNSEVITISRDLAIEQGECVNPGPDVWAQLSVDQRAAYAFACISATTK